MRRRRPPRAARWLRATVVGLILFYLVAPALIVIPLSFMGETMKRFPATELSLAAYRRFLEQPGWVTATLFSMSMAATVMVLSVVLGAATAYGIANADAWQKRTLSVLLL